jgi:hypothetical protein
MISAKAAGAKFTMLTVTNRTGFILLQWIINPHSMQSGN